MTRLLTICRPREEVLHSCFLNTLHCRSRLEILVDIVVIFNELALLNHAIRPLLLLSLKLRLMLNLDRMISLPLLLQTTLRMLSSESNLGGSRVEKIGFCLSRIRFFSSLVNLVSHSNSRVGFAIEIIAARILVF